MLEVDVVEGEARLRVQHGGDDGQAVLVPVVEEDEAGLALALHGTQPVPEEAGVAHHVLLHLAVPGEAEAQQLVELHVDAAGGTGEVQRVGVGLAAQVGDGDRHMLAEVAALAPHDPAGAAARLPVLVAARRDGEDVVEAEVPGGEVRLEGRDEAARGGVHVDAHLPSVGAVDLGHDLVHVPHGVVLAAVVVAHDADHAHGLLVDGAADALGVHLEGVP